MEKEITLNRENARECITTKFQPFELIDFYFSQINADLNADLRRNNKL
jgi:hypothetical protein